MPKFISKGSWRTWFHDEKVHGEQGKFFFFNFHVFLKEFNSASYVLNNIYIIFHDKWSNEENIQKYIFNE